MRITEEQRKTAANWLQEKIEHRRCLLCQSNQWTIGDELLVVPAEDPVVDPGLPPEGMVQVICENCGHVQLFDVRRITTWQFPVQDASHMPLM